MLHPFVGQKPGRLFLILHKIHSGYMQMSLVVTCQSRYLGSLGQTLSFGTRRGGVRISKQNSCTANAAEKIVQGSHGKKIERVL